MKKWALRLLPVFVLLLAIAAFLYACGKAQPTSTTTTTTVTSVTFTGTVAASSSDLSQLGVSSLAMETQSQKSKRVSTLKSMGFDEKSINAMNLTPLAAGDVTATLYKLNADGSKTSVATGTFDSSDSTYTVTDPAYSTDNTYLLSVSKANTTSGKVMEIETLVDQSASSASGSSAQGAGTMATDASITGQNSTPQTSLITKMVIELVIKELGVTKLDPETIRQIKTIVIAAINTMITDEGLTFTTVISSSQTDNTAMKNAALKAFSNDIVKNALRAIKFRAGILKGATDIDMAKKIMKEIFTFITGSPTGVPSSIVNSFATAYYNGVTKTVTDIVPAANGALTPTATSVFTEDNLAEGVKTLIDATYSSATVSGIGAKQERDIKAQNPLVQAILPASTFYGKSTTWLKAHSWTVPELLILMPVIETIAAQAGSYQINHPKMMVDMGLMTGIEDKFQIMHSELRVESKEDWENFRFDPNDPTAKPTVSSILTSFLSVENMVNQSATGTITATLTYQKANGTETTANYNEMSGFGPKSIRSMRIKPKGGGAGSGKAFQIAPWGDPSTAQTITDFKRGTNATITVYKDGTALETKTVAISSVNLEKAQIEWKTPAGNKFNPDDTGLTIILASVKPDFSWTFGSTDNSTIDFDTLTPAYAIEIRQTDQFGRADWSSNAIYSTWNLQDFLKGKQGETTSLRLPQTLTAGTYMIAGAVVALDANGWPIIQGPWSSTIFKVGDSTAIQAKDDVILSGTVTPLTSPQGTIKVGVFRMNQDTNFQSAAKAPVFGPTALTNNTYSITIDYATLASTGGGGYDPIAWDDANGDGKLDPTEGPSFPILHPVYNWGKLEQLDENFNPVGEITATTLNTGYDIDMTKYMRQ
ncbi:MAG: hypothetical protein HQ564_08960 [Candidatus Saganbacteria bacterium]|nr:hypothetical protein [Candidatus Saganbacteria bacterium]